MRKTIILCGILSALAGSAWSVDSEMDTDFMQSVDETNKSLASNIADKDAKASLAAIKELEAMFDRVEIFYRHKGDAEDAVELSRKSRDLTIEIEKLVLAKDFDTANAMATDLSRTCKSCHNFYKKS
jgi:cytochrome c556